MRYCNAGYPCQYGPGPNLWYGVQVPLGPYEACGMSGDDGKFLVRLPPMDAEGPYELTATAYSAVLLREPFTRGHAFGMVTGLLGICSLGLSR